MQSASRRPEALAASMGVIVVHCQDAEGLAAAIARVCDGLVRKLVREDVRNGMVPPEKLVLMSSNELMARQTREALDKAASDRTEARM